MEESRNWHADPKSREWYLQVLQAAQSGKWGTKIAARAQEIDYSSTLERGELPSSMKAVFASVEHTGQANDSFDLSFSYSVLEHVWDIDAALKEILRVTRRGGYSRHWVDLRSHQPSEDPLDMLRCGDLAWHLMGSNRTGAFPNRLRAREYAERAEAVGWKVEEVCVLTEAQEETILAAQPHFAPRFRGMSVADLIPLQIRLDLQKP